MTRDDLVAVLGRAAAGWAAGDARAVADCFAEDVDYLDPYRYRFTQRVELVPFFEPPVDGHHVTWHSILWDDEAQAGAVEYTYEGHHRYHGVAMIRLDADGRIVLWREWQHLDDTLDWGERLQGPVEDGSVLTAIDHVQLGMPVGGEPVARAFYVGVLGLREVIKPVALRSRGGVWFAGRAVAVHLGIEPEFRPLARAHPAFVVDDLASVRGRLADAGVEPVEDDSGLSIARCYVRDPFGNRLEFVAAADAGFSAGDRSEA